MFGVIGKIIRLKIEGKLYSFKDVQNYNFRRMLKYVYAKSKFYRELYEGEGIKEKDLNDVEVVDLPIIDKETVMDNMDNVFTDKRLKRKEIENYLFSLTPEQYGKKFLDEFILLHTSGSSGVVGYYVYGENDWDMLVALTILRVSKPKLFGKQRLCFIGATDGNFAGCTLARSAPTFMYEKLIIPVTTPTEDILKMVNEYQPDIVNGYGTGSLMLAEAQLNHLIDIHPKKLFSSGEPLSTKTCELTHKAWGIYPTNLYATTESISLGVREDPNDEFELFDDYHIFEILDQNDQEVDPGQEGSLVLTGLYNYTQPLIRYRLGDKLVKSMAPVDEYHHARISKIAGRKGVCLKYKNKKGEDIRISQHLLTEFLSPGVQRYQFIQPTTTELLLKIKLVEVDDSYVKEAKKRLDSILEKNNLKGCVKSKVEVVDEFLVHHKTGKFELIYPYKEKKAA